MQDLFGINATAEEQKQTNKNIKEFGSGKYREIAFEQHEIDTVFAIKNVLGHDVQMSFLRKRFLSNNACHAYIIAGNYGIGKATAIYNLIAQVIIDRYADESAQQAEIINLINHCMHSDIIITHENIDGRISVDDIRTLIDRLSLTAFTGIKFAIIDSLDAMNINAMNAILKTIEEPTPNTFIFLICHNISAVLPTIRSRCQVIGMESLSMENFTILMRDNCGIDLKRLHVISGGSIAVAKILSETLGNQIDNIEIKNHGNISKIMNELYAAMTKQKICSNTKIIVMQKMLLYLYRLGITIFNNRQFVEFMDNIKLTINHSVQFDVPII